MRPWTYKLGPLAVASANNIATSQTPNTAVTINGSTASGGVATLDVPRRVRITTGGDESGKTATITGYTYGSTLVTDVLALPASATTVDSAIDFKTITSINLSAGAANALTIGTNNIVGSPWFQPDPSCAGEVSLQVTVSGTANYTAQQTLDNPNILGTSVMLPYQMSWVASSDTNVVNATATKQSNYLFLPSFARILLNSQTNPAYVIITYIQANG